MDKYKLGLDSLTCVPPSPGSVLYHNLWCGPARGVWSWLPWAVAMPERASKPTTERYMLEISCGSRHGINSIESDNVPGRLCREGMIICSHLRLSYLASPTISPSNSPPVLLLSAILGYTEIYSMHANVQYRWIE